MACMSAGENCDGGMMLPGDMAEGLAKWAATHFASRRAERPFKAGPILAPWPFTMWQLPQP